MQYIFIKILIFLLPLAFTQSCSLYKSDKQKAQTEYLLGVRSLKAKNDTTAKKYFENAIEKDPFHSMSHYYLGKLYLKEGDIYSTIKELNFAIADKDNYLAKKLTAELYYKHNAYKEAIPLLKDIIANGYNDLQTNLALGISLIREGRSAEAVNRLIKTTEVFPNSIEAKLNLARALLDGGQKNRASFVIDTMGSLNEEDIDLQITVAQFYEKIGEHNVAEEKLKKIMSKFPDSTLPAISLAKFYSRQNKTDKAIKILDKSLRHQGKKSKTYLVKGEILHRHQDYDQAVDNFIKAAQISPDSKETSLILADYYVFLHEYDKALGFYQKISKQWPEDYLILSKISELAILSNNLADAESLIDKLIGSYPEKSLPHLQKGLLWLRKNSPQDAISEFKIAEKLEPESPEIFYLTGLAQIESDRFDLSKTSIMRALELNPGMHTAKIVLAYIYFINESYSLAVETIDQVIKILPKDLNAKKIRAASYFKLGNFRDAIPAYEDIVRSEPDNPNNKFLLAWSYENTGTNEKALQIFNEIIDTYKKPLDVLQHRVQVNLNKNNFSKALEVCTVFLEKYPGSPEASILKAGVLYRTNQYLQATEILNNVVKNNPTMLRPLILDADLQVVLKYYERAEALYEMAIRNHPGNIESYAKLADLYTKINKIDNAIETYEKLLEFAPKNIMAANNLAYLYAESDKNLGKALELALFAQKEQPESPESNDTLGFVYLKLDSIALAKRNIEKAFELRPADPYITYHNGFVLFKELYYQDAKQLLKEAISGGLSGVSFANASHMIREIEKIDGQVESAISLADNGNFDDAAKIFDNIIQEKGFYLPAVINLALIHADGGKNLEKAFEMLESALKFNPESAEAMDAVGWVYFKKGSILLAEKFLEGAVSKSPANPLFLFHLGVTYHDEQRFPEAEKLLTQAQSAGLAGQKLKISEQLLADIKKAFPFFQ